MVLDKIDSLYEKLKDSAEVFEGADRSRENFCIDYGVYCPRNKGCRDAKTNCPAYTKGMETLDLKLY